MITRKIKQRNSYRDLFFSTVFLAIVIILVGLLLASNWKISRKRAELNFRIEELRNKIAEIEEKKKALTSQISDKASEEFLEKEAREVFNLKKPGEEVVTILPPEQSQEKEPLQEEKPWWRILGF